MSTTAEFARRLRAAASEIDHTTIGIEGDAQVIRLGELAQTVRKIANEIDEVTAVNNAPDGRLLCWYEGVTVSTPDSLTGRGVDRELSLMAHLVDLEESGDFAVRSIRRMAAWLTDRYGEPDA